jgi:hypothetical protein
VALRYPASAKTSPAAWSKARRVSAWDELFSGFRFTD